MKKLLLTVLFCLFQLQALAMPPRYTGPHLEIDLPTQMLLKKYVNWTGIVTNPPTAENNWTLGGVLGEKMADIPAGSFTFTSSSGALFETNTEGKVGNGVTITYSTAVVTFSTTRDIGIGWSYEVVTVDGKEVIKLKYTIATTQGSFGGGFIVTPEMLGLDPYDTAYDAVTGKLVPNAAERLLNSSAVATADSPWAASYTFWKIFITTYVH